MPSPTLGEIAYTAWATVQRTPQPLYKALTYEERLGWGVGVHAAVVAVGLAGETIPQQERNLSLLERIDAVRQRILSHIQGHQLSMKQAGKQCGLDRHILKRWLDGEENITVRTLLVLEAWIAAVEPASAQP